MYTIFIMAHNAYSHKEYLLASNTLNNTEIMLLYILIYIVYEMY